MSIDVDKLKEVIHAMKELVITIGVVFAACAGYAGCEKAKDNEAKIVTVQERQVENAGKIDAAAVAATEVKNTLAVKAVEQDAKLGRIEKAVEAVPPRVAAEVRKDK